MAGLWVWGLRVYLGSMGLLSGRALGDLGDYGAAALTRVRAYKGLLA